ncbi:hypothetical protein NP233_g51 [Leucocoprinus birnbaumii]|uniref:FAD-binding domain-containing protein n=1 Tax=Leucocoprinus birnbaumii TaxID=56174 RepID=A0AAD5W2N1_9AGAR|nr:hypothetical protein NP233_g51 [Leucocoprinus birnbaumii]
MSLKLRIAIVGGGIGGLTLAVAIGKLDHDKVIEIHIYEAAQELGEIGLGLTIFNRTWELLRILGCHGLVKERAFNYSRMGSNLVNSDVVFVFRKSDQEAGFTFLNLTLPGGTWSLHRSDLHQALLNGLSNNCHVHLSRRVLGYEENERAVTLRFQDETTAQFDFVVGADGIKSAIRRGFITANYPSEISSISPITSGSKGYRALISRRDLERKSPNHRALRTPMMYCGKDKHVVSYPIAKGNFVNIAAFVSHAEEEGRALDGSPVQKVTQQEVLDQFQGWEEEVMDLLKDAYVLASVITLAVQEDIDISRATEIYNTIRQPMAPNVPEIKSTCRLQLGEVPPPSLLFNPMMADRPRRSTRLPTRISTTQTDKSGTSRDGRKPSRSAGKRKAPEPVDPQTQLHNILESPKSILTTTDISELINAKNWNLLPENSQRALIALLPSTAFDIAPDARDSGPDGMVLDSSPSSRQLNLNIFHDTHFLGAAHTLQDHIFSGWFTPSHQSKLVAYLDGLRSGTLAAPWKDEVWERENPRPAVASANPAGSHSSGAASFSRTNANAGASADLKLPDLVKDGVLRVGDIVAYKRNFSQIGLTVQKDTMIQSIDPLKHTLTVLMPKNAIQSLGPSLTCLNPDDQGSEAIAVTISTPQMLETFILDTDGRVKKSQRPNGNAWKCFTVYRWRKGSTVDSTADQRGGRDIHGSLFYLRGSHYYDR